MIRHDVDSDEMLAPSLRRRAVLPALAGFVALSALALGITRLRGEASAPPWAATEAVAHEPAPGALVARAAPPSRAPAPREAVAARTVIAHSDAVAAADPELAEEARAFAAGKLMRLGMLAGLPARGVLAVVPDELCALYPDPCARMRAEPDATLEELFGLPAAAELEASYRRGTVRALDREARTLTDWLEAIQGFRSREREHVRAGASAVTIHAYLADLRPAIDAAIARSDELWERIDAYGAEVVAAWSRTPTELDREDIEADIHAILWEERCRRDNAMLAQMPDRDAFWLHLSRVMSRHGYDDSYWMPPDELVAWYRAFDLHLAR
jgi:hypothetical protein